MAKARNLAYLLPIFRACLYGAELRQAWAASRLSNWLMATRVPGGDPASEGVAGRGLTARCDCQRLYKRTDPRQSGPGSWSTGSVLRPLMPGLADQNRRAQAHGCACAKRWQAASRVRRRRVWSSALAPPPPVISLFRRIISLFRPINSLFGAIKFAVISTIVACRILYNRLKRLTLYPMELGRKRCLPSPNSEYQARNDPQRSGRCARRLFCAAPYGRETSSFSSRENAPGEARWIRTCALIPRKRRMPALRADFKTNCHRFFTVARL